ncbi:MAG TPA: hypothetical protein DCQ06_07010 [Myxococcales bacterium]|nr:hypothetical protein [Myxococcales bacterium]
MVTTCVEHHALLLSWVDGLEGDDETLDVHTRCWGIKRAGELARTLAKIAKPDVDKVDLADAMKRRLRGWSGRARGRIPDHWIEWVNATMDCSAFSGVSRIPAHRDLQPRNWIHRNEDIVFLDWGHARYDAPMTDLVKLVCGAARHCPGGYEALLAGYGGAWSAQQCLRLRALCSLHGLSTATWAAQHGDGATKEQGIDILRWLKELGLTGFCDLISAESSFV